MWVTEFHQQKADNQFRVANQKEANNYLHRPYYIAITDGRRNVHQYSWVPWSAGKSRPECCFRRDLLFSQKVKISGHVISFDGIQPNNKRVEDFKNFKLPEGKRDVMKVWGSLGFYSCNVNKLHVDSKPFYSFPRDSTSFHWTDEHEKVFQTIRDRISKDTVPAMPPTEYALRIRVDSSDIATGCTFLQQFPEENASYSSSLAFLI